MTNRARSLRLRLSAGAVIVIVLALSVTGASLSELFARHLERRIGQELDTHLAQIIGSVRLDGNGLSLAREPADPRFAQIFGGLYWQVVDETSATSLRSRSLWDTRIALASDSTMPGERHTHDVPGPRDAVLFTHEETVLVPAPDGEHRLRVAVAIDRGEIETLASGFARDLTGVLVALGVVLVAGFWIQVSSGLKPIDKVLAGVAAIRAGATRRMETKDTPPEIAPLVEEVNALLDAQEAEMARARDRAADLAHGLKTPLTALAADIGRLRARGETGIADDIEDLAGRMRRHMERELARARGRHGRARTASDVGKALQAVIKTVKRTPEGERVEIEMRAGGRHAAAVEMDDLTEIIGNLVENAARHARSRVIATLSQGAACVTIAIADDGPGLDEHARAAALRRGGRLDTTGAGAGLGLAIVGDIVSACGGQFRLGRSAEWGGLEAVVTLPAGPAAQ